MNYDCKLIIKSGVSGSSDKLEFYSNGCVSFDNGVTTIEYEESEDTGLNAMNKVMISGDIVTLNRVGDNASTMIFEKGKAFTSQIVTPYGILPLSIFSHNVETDIQPNKATVSLLYSLDFNGKTTENEMLLEADII